MIEHTSSTQIIKDSLPIKSLIQLHLQSTLGYVTFQRWEHSGHYHLVCYAILRLKTKMFVYVGICMGIQLPTEAWGVRVPCSCIYRMLWATCLGCWGPLQEQCLLLIAEPILQPPAILSFKNERNIGLSRWLSHWGGACHAGSKIHVWRFRTHIKKIRHANL